MISAALQISAALGKDCLAVAEQIVGEMDLNKSAPRHLWNRLLSVLHEQHPDLMQTALGALFTYAVLEKIQGDSDASLQRHAGRGSGFPIRQGR